MRRHPPATPTLERREVRVAAGGADLVADLLTPLAPRGLIVFARGSGSGRASPRDRFVAERFACRGLASLLVDLLTVAEAEVDDVTGSLRFDIGLLAGRVRAAIDWSRREGSTRDLPLGLFGASTGAAAALVAAADRPAEVQAVVSRGGRPDLAGLALERVRAPVLMIVGSRDLEGLRLNQAAAHDLDDRAEIRLVPGATHRFEEPGALASAAAMGASWFDAHLGVAAGRAHPRRGRGRAL